MKKIINRGVSINKTMSDVKPVKNISKNPESFRVTGLVQKKSFLHINCKTMHMNNIILSD